MKTRYLILLLVISLFSQTSYTQNSTDAFRFSSYDVLGSARFVALGGAFGAVGGDLSTLNYNPAGLGIFQSSEFSFSPTLNYSSTNATYNGTIGTNSKTNLNYGMFGMVNTRRIRNRAGGNNSGWKAVNYGFSINRIKNFNNTLFMAGDSYSSSLANVWRDNANGTFYENLNSFSEGLAWETYILDTVPGNPYQYYSGAPISGVSQMYWEESKGYIDEMSFAISANYNDKLIIGFSLGIPSLHYERRIRYDEYALESPADYEFSEFHYKERLLTEGSGINAKIGFIYVISPSVRISGAYHTPTYYGELIDEYDTSLESIMGDDEYYYSESPIGNMVYSLNTPSRLMFGISSFFYKNGFISVDYEYMDYGKSNLSSSSYSFIDENQDIMTDFQVTHTLRIGAEWRLDFLTLRGGYNITSSPMNPDINDIISSTISWGAGYRIGSAYFDFAYSKRNTDNLFYMYNPDYVNPASISNTTSNYVFTIGYKF
ncbi:MAG: hypothetical protein J7K39_02970 [Bacteroidales bacterium]|nr:hypothetical protein [Bacteroidales bacterium]